MRRHALTLAPRWLLGAGAGYLIWSVIGDRPAWHGALLGAAYAAVMPLATAHGQRIRLARRTGSDDEISAAWRTYGARRPRWRGGWLHRSGNVVVVVPHVGGGGPRIGLATVRSVTERAPTRREQRGAAVPVRVLEVAYDGGRVDLAVDEAAVPDVLRWLDPDRSVASATSPGA